MENEEKEDECFLVTDEKKNKYKMCKIKEVLENEAPENEEKAA